MKRQGRPGQMAMIIVSSLILCLAIGCSHPPSWPVWISRGDYDQLAAYLDRRIDYEMRKQDIVGLSIAVMDAHHVRYARGFGYAHREAGVPATRHTVYRVGSLSKPVTATVAMTLVEEGRVDLEAPLARYLPNFAIGSRFPDAGPVTVKSLLAHYSGIPHLYRRSTRDGRPVPYNELVDMRDTYLVHPPGFVTKYSNHGYNLIGSMIEVVTRKPFHDYAREAVLDPLGMTTASYAPDPAEHPRLAKAYRRGKPMAQLPPLEGEIPSGGLHASVLDFARFVRLFFDHGTVDGQVILARETVQTMMRPVTDNPLDFDERPGLVWFHSAPPGLSYAGVLAGHGGNTWLYHARILIHPVHRLAVVVFTNTAEARIGQITVEAMKMALKVKVGLQPLAQDDPDTSLAEGVITEWQEYTGRYQTQIGVLDIAGGTHPQATLLGKRFRLDAEADGWTAARYLLFGSIPIAVSALAHIRFAVAEIGEHTVLVVSDRGRKVWLGERIEPRPIPPVWRDRLGDYNLTNAALGELTFAATPHARLRLEDNYLILYVHPAIHPSVELSWIVFPVTDTEAVFAGLNNYLGGETLHVVQRGGTERVVFSGYEFERMTE